jgi:hypothetical protein
MKKFSSQVLATFLVFGMMLLASSNLFAQETKGTEPNMDQGGTGDEKESVTITREYVSAKDAATLVALAGKVGYSVFVKMPGNKNWTKKDDGELSVKEDGSEPVKSKQFRYPKSERIKVVVVSPCEDCASIRLHD